MADNPKKSKYTRDQIDAALARAKAGGAIDTLLANKAPDGYGLGSGATVLTDADDLNAIYQNGWYTWSASVPQNAPKTSLVGSTAYAIMRTCSRNNRYVLQEFWNLNDDCKYKSQRFIVDGVPKDLEWVNPPMKPGVEYKTTERYEERPVYVKVVDVGNTVAGRTVKEHGISNIKNIVRFFGNSSTDSSNFNGLRPMPFIAANSLTNAWTLYVESVDRTEVVVYAGSSIYGAPTRVTVYYTKTAD